MLPSELSAENFRAYPPEGRQLATRYLGLLQHLPLGFVPLLLKEIISYDWKFPAERKDMDRQLAYLSALAPEQRSQAIAGFAGLHLSPALERFDWVNSPAQYSENLTAHLWATHQIDAFHAAAVDYLQKVDTAAPKETLPVARLAIVVVGQGVQKNQYPLFRKLRKHGVYFSGVKPENGVKTLLDAVAARAAEHPVPYAHWYIDGGEPAVPDPAGVACISYQTLAPARAELLNKMEKAIQSGIGGPEALRTMMARMRPEEIGLGSAPEELVLNAFQVSVLTEGSGTQIFSTTFVQWAAREALRRAQPLTLMARFAPRQRQRPMNEMIAQTHEKMEYDPAGSLIDADMGAFYTWLNQQRLPGVEQSSFLVWFEDHAEALAIAPSLPRATTSESAIDLKQLVGQIT